MKGDQKVIDHLNKILANELTAINQYFLHARMCKNWGFQKLNEYEYHESIDEMKHADALIERILFLEGIPNLQDLNKIMIGEDVPEILKCDLELEKIAHPDLVAAIAYCEEVKDYISRELLVEYTITSYKLYLMYNYFCRNQNTAAQRQYAHEHNQCSHLAHTTWRRGEERFACCCQCC